MPSPGRDANPRPALLSRRQMEEAFAKLDDRLHQQDVVADVYLIGGAAMVLEFNARPATRDEDEIWHPLTARFTTLRWRWHGRSACPTTG